MDAKAHTASLIAALKLEPHPEGGHYRETFRDTATDPEGRARSTAIYYLLGRGERSAWHRVDAVEIWHHYAGAPLHLFISADGATIQDVQLGPDVANGAVPQAVVPAGHWQAAVSAGDWTLVGCTVAPAFRFEGFELAPADFALNRIWSGHA